MIKPMHKQDWNYRFQQLVILIAHLILLKWILHVLHNGGSMTMNIVLTHFTGMALYGALLIRGTALWAKRRYIKEQKSKRKA